MFTVGERYLVWINRKTLPGICISVDGDTALIEFDDPIPGGHDGNDVDPNVRGRYGHCWWCSFDRCIAEIDNEPKTILVKAEAKICL